MSYRKFINAKKFSIVVATDGKNGIGRNGTIPWDSPEDRKAFAKLTTGSTLIVGRKTFESLPRLKYRKFIVLTTRPDVPVESTENEAIFASSLNEAIELCRDTEEELFVAGGAGVYNEAILHPCCNAVYRTMIGDDYQCDRAFHGIGALRKHYNAEGDDSKWTYIMCKYTRKYAAECQYLNTMTDIINDGELKENRTGIDTMAKFSQHFRYPLTNSAREMVLPMLTSKRVSFKLVYSELLWLIRGSNTTDFLVENNNHIWDANATREFLDKRGLNYYREGELGPVYGFQWRHFGADYVCENAKSIDTSDSIDSTDSGIDQLQNVIDGIKKDPYGRRHIVTAWNPSDINEMALPPCHHTFTFYVQRDELCCHLSMRSNDMFLGHPFNVASYALLTHMIASLCGLRATELTITSVDCHVYTNHFDAVKESLERELYGFPTITIQEHTNIDDFNMSSIKINNYYSNSGIRADMAV